jgi:hypothetical protein
MLRDARAGGHAWGERENSVVSNACTSIPARASRNQLAQQSAWDEAGMVPRTIQTWDFFYCLFWSPAEYEEHDIKINN